MKIAAMLVACAMALAACDLADQATSFMPKLADQAASFMPKTVRQSDPAPPAVEPEPDVKELIRAKESRDHRVREKTMKKYNRVSPRRRRSGCRRQLLARSGG
jgi:hypothetical protein